MRNAILEHGSDVVSEVYYRALNGELTLSFSAWNIGEVFGVIDRYHRRGWLSDQEYEKARTQFIGETVRLLKLKLLRIVPVKTRLLMRTWPLIEKYHIYEADALQIVSVKHVKAKELYTGERNKKHVLK